MPFALSASRSPFAAASGALGRWHPVDLAAHIATDALSRAGLDPTAVDELWVGCEEPVGAQGAHMARAIILAAGWPHEISGAVVDRGESSASAALHAAAAAISAGQIETAVVLGVHSASTVSPGASALGRTYGRPWGDGPAARVADQGGLLPAPRQAEASAAAAGINRLAQDAWAVRSYERRSAVIAPNTITPTNARPSDGSAVQRGAKLDADTIRVIPVDLSALPPMFDHLGTITSASFAPPADGVAAIVLTRTAAASTPELIANVRGAGHPVDPTGGLDTVVTAALRDIGAEPGDVGTWLISERTAAGALLAARHLDSLGIDPERINPNGGSLAVGDAGAADDLRLSTDGLAIDDGIGLVATIAYGMAGAAVSVWTRQ